MFPQIKNCLISALAFFQKPVFSLFVLLALFSSLYSYTRVTTPLPVAAATSSTINFQARLSSSSGQVVPDGNYYIEFNLYTASSGGSSVWRERYQGSAYACDFGSSTGNTNDKVRVVNGYLTVNLGHLCTFPSTINWDQEHWLTMNVGGAGGAPAYDGEMSPRLKLTAVPYALSAGQLAKTSGANRGTLSFNTVANNPVITLPDATGTITLQSTTLTLGSIPFADSNGILAQDNTNLFFDDTNNTVGIGTTRSGAINGTGNSRLVIQGSGNTSATSALNVRDSSGTGSLLLVRDDGNVGIGTISPGAKLQVSGTTFLNGGVDIGDTAYLDSTVALSIKSNRAYLLSVFDNAVSPQLVLTQAGKLGLGLSPAGGGGDLQLEGGTTADKGISFAVDTNLYRSAAETLKTDDSFLVGGRLGIGTSAPFAKLQVQNEAALAGTGTISSSGTTVTGSGTSFTTQLSIGDTIIASGQSRRITAIASNTSLTTVSAFNPVISGGTSFTYEHPIARLQATASQVADLLRVENSAAASLVRIDSAGRIFSAAEIQAFDGTAILGNNKLQINGGSFELIGGASAGQGVAQAQGNNPTKFIIKGGAGGFQGTTDLFQLQTDAGTILTSFDNTGKLVFGPTGSQDTNLYRSAADILRTDDSLIVGTIGAGGTNLLCYDGSNKLSTCSAAPGAGNYIFNGTSLQTSANFHIQAADSGANGTVGGIIRGAAGGQTVDLLQFKNTGGTTLSGFKANGNLYLGENGTVNITLTSEANGSVDVLQLGEDGSGVLREQHITSADQTGTGSAANLVMNPGASAGLNQSGAFLAIAGGLSTGNAAGGSIFFNTSNSGASGSGVNSFVNRWGIDGATGHLYPISNDTYDVGFNTFRVRNIYTGKLDLAVTSATTGSIDQNGSRLIHTYGTSNFFAGANSGNITQTGSGANVGIGANVLSANTTGNNNSAFGANALVANQAGNLNTAIGSGALGGNVGGIANTGLGSLSLLSNSSGNFNTAVGYLAGYTSVATNANTTGSNNTFIGYNAGPGVVSATNLQNATSIGYASVVNQNDSLVLGCINGTNGCTASTKVGIGTAAPSYTLDVASSFSTANSNSIAARIIQTDSGTANGNETKQGLVVDATYSGTYTDNSGLVNNLRGIQSTVTFSGSLAGADDILNLSGGYFNPVYSGSVLDASDLVNVYGMQAVVTSNLGTVGGTQKFGSQILVSGTANNNTGLSISVSGASAHTGISNGVTSSSTTAGSEYGISSTVSDSGVVTSGTDTTYGQNISVTRTGATGGTINTYGLNLQASGDNAGAGTSTITGLNVAVSGTADNTYAALFSGGNVGIGTATPAALLHVSSSSATTLFRVTDETATARDVVNIADGGAATFRNQTDSTTAFQIQNAAGTSNLFVADTINTRIGIGTNAPTSNLHVAGGTIANDGSSQNLKVTGTLASAATANQEAAQITVTSAGSAGFAQRALVVTLNAGFTGGARTEAGRFVNNVAGTGTDPFSSGTGNFGIKSNATATTIGTNVGLSGYAVGGNVNIGLLGSNDANKDNSVSIGVMSSTVNSGGVGRVEIGGYFGLQNSAPTFTSAALIANNSAEAVPIFLAQDNGTTVFTVADGGAATFRNQTDSTAAFAIQNATASNTLFIADTQNQDITITSAGTTGSGETALKVLTTVDKSGIIVQSSDGISNGEPLVLAQGDFIDDKAFQTKLTGNAFGRFNINIDGTMNWGDGSSARDTNLRRSAANTLQTDDAFIVGGSAGTNSTTAFQVQNTANASLLTVDTLGSHITLLGNNAGTLQSWTTNGSGGLGARRETTAVTANGYIFVLGGSTSSTPSASTTVYSGKILANGAVDTWTTLTGSPLPAARADGRAVYANGYIYYVGGEDNTPTVQSTVYYARVNSDGTLGTWVTSTATGLPIRAAASVATVNGYIYVIGGETTGTPGNGTTTTYYAKINADGSVGNWNTTAALSGDTDNNRTRTATAVANGYIYVMGGGNNVPGRESSLFYAKPASDGTISAWTFQSTALVSAVDMATAGVANGYVYVIGGQSVSGTEDDVQYAPLNANGSTGTWNTTTVLPTVREQGTSVVANGYIYQLNGSNGTTIQSTVYYATTSRLTVGGSLDLVGFSGENLAEGGSGGSLTAGNTNIVGTLQVQDMASFMQGVSINKELSVAGSALFKNEANSTKAFQIQNAAGTSNLFVADTTNTRIGIGSAAPSDTLEVVGNIVSKGTAWTIRSTSPVADKFWDAVTYGNGIFVAVATNSVSGNLVMTSPDGINWTSRTSAADNTFNSVTYGNGIFVAVASNGTGNRVMTSTDGITWTARSSAADNAWQSVTYGNGLFVAVACGVNATICNATAGNRVMTSPDGINWTLRTTPADISWKSVTYGNGTFVAVAISGTGNRVMSSSDGITWASQTSAADNFWQSVTYGNGLFVAVSSDGTGNRVMTSPTGSAWTPRTSAADNEWYDITYGNGLFVAVGITGTGNRVMTSPDGINWVTRASAADNTWGGVTYGNGLFVAVATSGTGNRAMTSGKTETSAPSPSNTYQGGMTVYGNTLYRSDANSATAFQIQNAATSTILGIDTLSTPNLVVNPSFEQNTTGWAAKAGTTISRITTQQYIGSASLQIDVNAANEGATYPYTFTNGVTYFLSFYARTDVAMTTIQAGIANDGTTELTCTLNPDPASVTVTTAGWKRYSCSFTAGVQSGSPYFFIRQSDATARAIYIDAVQLQITAVTAFQQAQINLNGVISSPISFKNQSDSTTAFEIQNAAGTSVLQVNTVNGRIGINTANPERELHLTGIARFDRASNSAGLMIHRTGQKTFFLGVDAAGVDNGEFFISDLESATTGAGTRRLTIEDDGSIIIGTNTTSSQLFQVDGTVLIKNSAAYPNSPSSFQIQSSGSSTPVFNVDTSNGRVGIGTNAPAQELDVVGDIQLNANGTATVNALCHSGADSDTTFADRDIVACNPGTLTDFAEYYPTEPNVEYGDLVVIGSESVIANAGDGYGNHEEGRDFNISKLAKSTSPYQSSSIGVVSKNFGDFTALGQTVVGPEHKPMPIALNGRVPVKVTTENGPILPGDLLTTSSTPGAAMKATGSGRVIGTALGAYNTGGIGQIFVFVNAHWYEPPIADALQDGSGNFDLLNVTGQASISSLNVSGATILNTLTVNTVTVTGNLTVQGLATVASLRVEGSAEVLGDVNLAGVGESRNAITKKFIASVDIEIGDVVVADPSGDGQVTTTTASGDTKVLGIALTDTPAGEEATIAIGGSVQVKAASTTIVNGDLLVSSTTSGAADKSATPAVGSVLGKSLGKPDANNLVWVLVTLN